MKINKIKIMALAFVVLLVSACGVKKVEDNNTTNSNTTNSNTTNNSEVSNNGLLKMNFNVSLADAIKIFNDKYPEVVITSISFEKEMNSYIYNIEGADDNNEYEIYINAEDKTVNENRVEALDNDEKNGLKKKNEALDLTNYIMPDVAMQLALDNSSANGVIDEYSIDQEMNVTYYEINVKDGNNEYDVKIDVKTSEVLSVEND